MKRFYELDRTIRNVSRERSEVLEELFTISWTFDLKEFEKHLVRLMLTCRRLTIKLVKLVKEWKHLNQRKTATLFVVVNDQPQRPTGLKSSTSRNSQVRISRQQKKQECCVLCYIEKNPFSSHYGQLMQKFMQCYLQDNVLFIPATKPKDSPSIMLAEKTLFRTLHLQLRQYD